jgi:ceramide glucosyltransferase
MGKSMLLRRTTLAELGGFRFLARYLAEDQVCGQEIARRRHTLALASQPVLNVLGPVTVRQFIARHLRWARIRRHMAPLGYLGEFLLNPIFIAGVALAVRPSALGLGALLAVVAAKSALDLASERAAGVLRSPLAYPLIVTAKDMMLGFTWIIPWFSSHVAWRGNRLHIGRRTVLEPVGDARWVEQPGFPEGGADLSPAGG